MSKKSPVIRVRALIIHGQHVLLLKRIKKGHLYYTFPGGHVEKGETDEDGLIREGREETNLDIVPGKLIKKLRNSEGHIVKLYRCSLKGVDENILPEAKMVGEELERSSEDNQYILEWVPFKSFPKKGVKLAQNVSIMPDIVR